MSGSPRPAGFIDAVRGVSFGCARRSTLAVVGESGSGKSVVSQSILRILPRNGEICRGAILFTDPRDPGQPVDLARLPGRRAGDAVDSRRPHLDHLPGADEFAVAAAHGRRPGRRGAAAAPQGDCGRGERTDDRDAAPRRVSGRRARLAKLSVRAVGRVAAARDDRDGAGLPPGPRDRRRADDRARRDDPGADPEADRRVAAGTRHGRAC